MEISFDKISKIASIILGKQVTPYDVATILHAMKLSRISNDPTNPDHYIDGINYMAFMGQFAGVIDAPEGDIEGDIAAMARRFAPRQDDGNAGIPSSS